MADTVPPRSTSEAAKETTVSVISGLLSNKISFLWQNSSRVGSGNGSDGEGQRLRAVKLLLRLRAAQSARCKYSQEPSPSDQEGERHLESALGAAGEG